MMRMASICDDISEFLDTLKKMRVVDDKIVNALNTTVPTESFSTKIDANATCKDLFSQIVQTHVQREKSLQQCLSSSANKLESLRAQKASNPNDIQLLKNIKREQIKLREIQTQVNVEEVIRQQTMKVYQERCRSFYKPTQEEKDAITFSRPTQ